MNCPGPQGHFYNDDVFSGIVTFVSIILHPSPDPTLTTALKVPLLLSLYRNHFCFSKFLRSLTPSLPLPSSSPPHLPPHPSLRMSLAQSFTGSPVLFDQSPTMHSLAFEFRVVERDNFS
eukprot:759977-Hanusia_phi.AAC.5